MRPGPVAPVSVNAQYEVESEMVVVNCQKLTAIECDRRQIVSGLENKTNAFYQSLVFQGA